MSPRKSAQDTPSPPSETSAPALTSSTPSTPSTEPADAPDPNVARAAFEQLLPRLRAIPKADIKTNRPGLQEAATYALGIARRLQSLQLRPRFAALPSDVFDIAHYDLLETIAAAAWYAQVQLDSAMATTTEAKVSLALIQESTDVKNRMLQVVDYHLAHRSPTLALEIEDIRSGTGHVDRASDLSRLGKLYVDQRALLPSGPDPHYRPEDADAAGRLASATLAELAAARTKAQEDAQDLAARAWTFLLSTYEEVADAGRLVLKKEGGRDFFQSLYTVGRTPVARRRPPKSSGSAGSPGGTPSTPPTPSTPTKPPAPAAAAPKTAAE